jgi:hypothetical protein
MILLDTAAHRSRVDLQLASHLLFIGSTTWALLETEHANNTRDAIATKRVHLRRQNLVLIVAVRWHFTLILDRAVTCPWPRSSFATPCRRAIEAFAAVLRGEKRKRSRFDLGGDNGAGGIAAKP